MIQCRDKKVVDLTEAEVTRQTLADLQEQVANLTAAVAAMNTQRTAPMNQHERPMHADDNEDSDDDENPFAALRRTTALRNNNNNNDSDSEDDDTTNRWKSSFKLEIPEFKGFTVPEDLLTGSSPSKTLWNSRTYQWIVVSPLLPYVFETVRRHGGRKAKQRMLIWEKQRLPHGSNLRRRCKKIFFPTTTINSCFKNYKF